jgi:hypothetical protein
MLSMNKRACIPAQGMGYLQFLKCCFLPGRMLLLAAEEKKRMQGESLLTRHSLLLNLILHETQALYVFIISAAIVMGPTPPGTGVI